MFSFPKNFNIYLVIKKKSEKSENAGAHDILLNISAAFSFYVK